MKKGILVLDFGSQYTQLIARRLREIEVYSELLPFNTDIETLKSKEPVGIILSGGPHSVGDKGAPKRDIKELAKIAPLLGICYGMQLICKNLGGEVEASNTREYGHNTILWQKSLTQKVPKQQKVWMSHGDVVKKLPAEFELLAESGSGHPSALRSDHIWALQFHPEVAHTEKGTDLLKSFVFDQCQAEKNWQSQIIANTLIEDIKLKHPKDEVILCALSGGVDSTVTATLLTKALGKERVPCLFVDTGLLRKNEFKDVLTLYKELDLNVKGVDASPLFLERLKGKSDPEEKRKIIGASFIHVFKEYIKDQENIEYLAQGTLYPDVIESVSPLGQSVTIKSHHNVGGLPKDLNLKLVEPLKELFKDEVRKLGEELGLSHKFLWRHPFPGPGLAIRVLTEINEENIKTLQECDAIYIEELRNHNLYDKIWQAFVVLLPVKTVGVQGDGRTYERVVAIRAVTSMDGMTADWFDFSPAFLRHVSNRMTNEVKAVNRVVYDITSKPPGTIEWE